MKKSRQIISLLLSVLMITALFTAVPFTASAAEDNTAEVGAGELRITTEPYDVTYFKDHKYRTNKTFSHYPILRYGVQGGSGTYTFMWYRCPDSATGTYTLYKTTSAPVLEVKDAGYYKSTVKDTVTNNVVTTDVWNANDNGLPKVKFKVEGTKIIWAEDPIEEQFDCDWQTNSYYGYCIILTRYDKTHNEKHTVETVFVYRIANGEVRSSKQQLGTFGVAFDSDGNFVKYDSEKHVFSLDLGTFGIINDSRYDDIQYKYTIHPIVDTTERKYPGFWQDSPYLFAKYMINDEVYYYNDYSGLEITDPREVPEHQGEVQILEKNYYIGDTLTANINGGRLAGRSDLDIIWQRRENGKWVDRKTGSNSYTISSDDIEKLIRFIVQPKTAGYIDGEAYVDDEIFVSNEVVIKKNTCTVTFDKNGGTGTMSSVQVNKGSSYTLPECTFTPPSSEYEFAYWTVDGINRKPGDTITVNKDLTVTAVWQQTKYVTVTFDKNGGTGTMGTYQAHRGYSFTLPNCSFTPPSGKMFDCWLVDGERIKAYGSFVATKNVTAVARWVNKPVITTISKMDVYLDKLPADGNLPSLSASAPVGSGYHVATDYNRNYYQNGVWWQRKTAGGNWTNVKPETERFVEGTEYKVSIMMFPDDGYEFNTSGMTATLNGEAATVPNEAGNWIYTTSADVTQKFTCGPTDLIPITEMDFTVTAPVAGQNPDYNVIFPTTSPFEIDSSRGVSWRVIGSADTFVAGETYSIMFYVIPDDGFYFDPDKDVMITINGEAKNYNVTSNYKFRVQVMRQFVCVAGDHYIIGDVNNDGAVKNRDALILDRYIAGWKDYDKQIKNWDAADMNRDGQIKNRDALMLDRYIAGWKDYQKYVYQVNG